MGERNDNDDDDDATGYFAVDFPSWFRQSKSNLEIEFIIIIIIRDVEDDVEPFILNSYCINTYIDVIDFPTFVTVDAVEKI